MVGLAVFSVFAMVISIFVYTFRKAAKLKKADLERSAANHGQGDSTAGLHQHLASDEAQRTGRLMQGSAMNPQSGIGIGIGIGK